MSGRFLKVIVVLTSLTVIPFPIACSSSSDTDNEIIVGSQAQLRGGPEATIVATDQDSIQAFVKAKMAKDEYGLRELVIAGKIFAIPNKTKVLVIDIGWVGEVQVRILEGQFAGKAVWTDFGWLTKETETATEKPSSSTPDTTSSKQTSAAISKPQSLDERLFGLLDEMISTEIGEQENPANVSAVLALIDQGANVNAGRGKGQTPLIKCARNGHIRVMKILLEKGADINAQDESGMTALMWAAHMGDPEMTRLLISKGAKLNIRNNDGFTALSFTEGATDELHLEVIRILRKAGAK
jgi:hypothetical protein